LGGDGYQRQPASFEYCLDGVTIANVAAIQWSKADMPWGTLDLVLLWDAQAGGNLLGEIPVVGVPVDVPQYAIARIPPAGIPMVQTTGPRPYGVGTFGTGRFGTDVVFYAPGSGVGSPYGVGPYGWGPYAALPTGALLEVAWGAASHVCKPGAWLPGPYKWAA
jgi:hypothetical protein